LDKFPTQDTNLTPLDQFNFHHTLSATRGVSLVFFTSHACSVCRLWRHLLIGYSRHEPDITLFEVDAQRDMALTREFELFHLPALFLYQDGDFHCPLQCEAHAGKLALAIQAALSAPAQELP
jgi:hypothetical protein